MAEFVNIVIDKRAGKERKHDAILGSALPIRIHESDFRASVEVKDGRRLLVEEPSYKTEADCLEVCRKFNETGQL